MTELTTKPILTHRLTVYDDYDQDKMKVVISRRMRPGGKTEVLILHPEPHWQEVEYGVTRPATLFIAEEEVEARMLPRLQFKVEAQIK